jgi:glycosyltransferase involved in cell wall biosynthesis
LDQTFCDHEVLIYDDGSEDETQRVISRAASRDGRVRLVGSERVGLAGALQRAIEASDAELIARMDADDISHPERLEALVDLLDTRGDIAIASSLVRHFVDKPEEDGAVFAVPMGMRRYERWLNSLVTPEAIARDLLVESPLCHPSVAMRRAAYEETSGYVDDDKPEDYGLWLEAARRGLKMAKADRVLFHWRDSPDRLSRTHGRYAQGRFTALKVDHLRRTHLRTRAQVTIWGAGKLGRRWHRALEPIGCRAAEFIDVDPKKIGREVHGEPVIPPPPDRSALRSDFVIVAVGAYGARALIREHLTARGFTELEDFVCVA